ncbi:MAG: DUF5615 family PIN-like protein [Chloroflexota bacterium]
MTIWVNAQISPAIAAWIVKTFSVEAVAVRDLQLRDATDTEIFNAARNANAIVLTKDSDFVAMVNAHGTPRCLANFAEQKHSEPSECFLFPT